MLSLIIQLVFYFTVTFVCVTYFFFLLYLHREKSKIQLSILLKVITLETLCILTHVILYPIANLKLKIKHRPGINKYPILLIPGFMENQTDWWFHRNLLHRQGITNIYTINLWHAFTSIEKHAIQVHHAIQRILQETNQSKVILIGHSRGGLVASYCNEQLAKGKIAAIITLATPFKGASLATYLLGKNRTEMMPNSSFIQSLITMTRKNTITPYYCIVSTMDSLIFPWQNCIPYLSMESLLQTYVVGNIGHNGLLKSFTVNIRLISWLKNFNR